MSQPLIIHEIYRSLQGESSRTGLPCVLIRLAGCNLDCTWCDTPGARNDDAGEAMEIDAILAAIAQLNCPRVEVTGGEPLLQPGAIDLLSALCDAGFETLLETNGSIDTSSVDDRVIRIIDVKCPASGQAQSMYWPNLEALRETDEIKFVIANHSDYEYARDVVVRYSLAGWCNVIFSPISSQLPPAELARWILDDGIDVRLGLQLHKILWPDAEGGV